MKIADHTVYAGPHLHGDPPAVVVRLERDPASPALDTMSLMARARDALPELEHRDLEACGGGSAPLEIEHWIAHLCNALHRRAGVELPCLHRSPPRPIPAGHVALAYEEVEVALDALALALDWIDRAQVADGEADAGADEADAGADEASAEESAEVDPIDRFVRSAARRMLPVQDRALIAAARRLDIPTLRVTGRIVQFGQGRNQVRLSATKTSRTNVVSNDLAANKDYARRVLEDLGLPVPRYERVYRLRDVADAAKRIGFPVVVKPNNGSMGGGVSVGVKSQEEAIEAYRRARDYGRSVLIEEQIEGEDFRMLVVDGKLVAASRRVPGHVVGDGTRSVGELVYALNEDPRRGDGPTFSWTRLHLDDQAHRLLAEIGYDPESVPGEGEVVFLRRNANTSAGGTAVDVTDDVHPDNREIAERTARAIGLDIAGVDFLTRDISTSMWKNGGRICEVNSRPGIRKHMWPAEGRARDVTTPILDMLFPAGRMSRVPVIAVSGTGATGATAEMLQHVFAGLGHRVGARVRRRLRIAGRRIRRRGRHPFDAMRTLVLDPDVALIVFEITPGEIVDHGLPFDAFDHAVVVNDSSAIDAANDAHDASEVASALDLLARHTRGSVHLAHDDLWWSGGDRGDPEARVTAVWRDGFSSADPPPAGPRVRRVEVAPDALRIHDADDGSTRIPRPLPASVSSLEASLAEQAADASVYAALCAHAVDPRPRDITRVLNEFDASVLKPRARKGKGKRRATGDS